MAVLQERRQKKVCKFWTSGGVNLSLDYVYIKATDCVFYAGQVCHVLWNI